MKHEKLADALSELDERHIEEALKSRRHSHHYRWIAAVAAVLVLAITLGLLMRPGTQPEVTMQTPTLPSPTAPSLPAQQPVEPTASSHFRLASASYPTITQYPGEYDYDAYIRWSSDLKALHNQPDGYADNLEDCWNQLVPALLSGESGQNTTCSPLNIYMALAMLAECTDGESRSQILDLLNADTIEALRKQANQVWRAHYNNDGLSKSVLGSSLWLQEGYSFDPSTVSLLAENYYASVFQGNLGSADMNKALQNWLNEQTSNLLTDQVQNVRFDPMTVLALATTIDYQVQWMDFQFSENKHTEAIFHGANGDTTETFMNINMDNEIYYWGDRFGAISLPLEDGSRMWLILPDAGVFPEEITQEVMTFLADPHKKDQKRLRVNLSLPKFDVVSQRDICAVLQQLGVADVFDGARADFSPILSDDDDGYVSSINHAARVMIDENGVTAAAFTLILRAGAAMPPEDQVDFTLDRPFLFCVESNDGLPLFAGIVNEP